MQATKRNAPKNISKFPLITLTTRYQDIDHECNYYVIKLDWLNDLVCIDEFFAAVTVIAIGDNWQEANEVATQETAVFLRSLLN